MTSYDYDFMNFIVFVLNWAVKTKSKETGYTKQILHAFLFNIKNYSPEVIDIHRYEAELNIILLPRVNNFDIKQKGMEYLFDYMPPTPNMIWKDKD